MLSNDFVSSSLSRARWRREACINVAMAVDSHYKSPSRHLHFLSLHSERAFVSAMLDSGCKIIMSQDNIEEEADISCCALCGIAEIVDDIKLKDCDGCDLVRYCSDDCQIVHQSEHEEECKKRAAELRDELLFRQPESTHMGDCPICCLPLPFELNDSTLMWCCSKTFCNGCRQELEARERRCPFCRRAYVKTYEESEEQRMKRVEANDPAALRQEGATQLGKGEYQSAFEYYTKAAAMGDAEAHCRLARFSVEGQGVEKDEEKEVYHLEEAAIGGHPEARYYLGCYEWGYNNNAERAVKHLIIAATLGDNDSLKMLMIAFKEGLVSKDELAAVLRAQQAAVDATKSPQRKAAEGYYTE